MALHTETAARTRLMTFGSNICLQCSAHLLAPEWSEYLNEHRARHSWSCEARGHQFETTVFFPSGE